MKEWFPIDAEHSDVLERNLAALGEKHPALADAVQPVLARGDLLARLTAQGFAEVAERDGDGLRPLWTEADIRKHEPVLLRTLSQLSPPPTPALLYLLGFDAGYSLQRLVKAVRPGDDREKYVLIAEPDIRLFAAALAVCPMENELRSRHIHWAVGEGWQARIRQLMDERNLFSVTTLEPVFAGTAGRSRAFVVEARKVYEEAKKDATDGFYREMSDAKQYYLDKKPGKLKRILAIHIDAGFAVLYIQQRFLEECADLGLEVHYFHSQPVGGIAMLRAIAGVRPDFMLFMNWHPSEYVPMPLLNELRMPRVTWCIDDPYSFIKKDKVFYEQDFVWNWDNSYEDCFVTRQAQSVDYFPYVADFDRLTAEYRDKFASPVSYVGQAVKLDPKRYGYGEGVPELIQRVAEIKAKQMHRSYASITLEVQHEFDLEIIKDESEEIHSVVRYGMYVVANALRRIHVLERVMPFGLKFYGNEGWVQVLENHPLLDCYQGVAHPQEDVPHIFASSRINLNIHSIQALTSLNQRDFNCPLVGGFLLTDWVENAEQMFVPDEELVFYRDLDDLEEKVRYYLEHDDEREAVIRKGRERVLKEHTYKTRVPKILETLEQRIQERFS